MRANLFWFADEQWSKIEPLLPTKQPGAKPKKNRRVLSGIMYVLKVGCRWQDCPLEYGPDKTIYRFNRGSGRRIWRDCGNIVRQPMVDYRVQKTGRQML
jgi:transposase